MNVIEVLDETCRRLATAPALIWNEAGGPRTLSFAEFHERSCRVSSLLRHCGLRPGDAVAVFLPMSDALYAVTAGVLRCGLVPVFVDPVRWRETAELAAAKLPLRGFVGTPAACAARWLAPALRRIPHVFVAGGRFPGAIRLQEADRRAAATDVEHCTDEATALVTFTSGSTGRPKGVLRTHRMLLSTHRMLASHLSLQPGETALATLPFIVFVTLAAGATTVLPRLDLRHPSRVDAQALVAQLRQWRVSHLVATPFLAGQIAACCRPTGPTLDSLRSVSVGGAPVLPELLDRLALLAPRARICAVYGATEAEPIAFADRSDFGPSERNAVREGGGVLAGRPADGVSVRVLAERDRPGPPAPGEIVVRGPNVSPHYLDAEDDRRHKIEVDGALWHRTGDAGYFDPSGRLWLAGRCAARIEHAGKTLYPLQVEAALSGASAIERGTVVRDANGRAVVALQPAGRPQDIDLAEVARRLAWCGLDEIAIVKEIPLDRRHHAKVVYQELARALSRGKCLARTTLAPLSGETQIQR